MKKTFRVIALLLAMVFILSACSGEKADSSENNIPKEEPSELPVPESATNEEAQSPEVSSTDNTRIRYEGDGFDTPEDAICYYFDGLRNLDVSQMLGAFAWETMINRFSVEAYLERLGNYSPTTVPRFLPKNTLLNDANLEAMRARTITTIYHSIGEYIFPDGYDYGLDVYNIDSDLGTEFLQGFRYDKLARLTGMSEVRFYTPDDVTNGQFSRMSKEKWYKQYAKMYCADEMKEMAAVADIGGELLAVLPVMARYGDKWYIASLNSSTASMLVLSQYSRGFFTVESDRYHDLLSATPYSVLNIADRVPAVSGNGKNRYEGDGFDSPEDAVLYYLDGLRNRDIQQMLRAFAWETQNSRYSVISEIRRINAYNHNLYPNLFPENDLLISANLEIIRSQVIGSIYRSIEAAMIPKQYEGLTVALSTEGETFMQSIRYDRLDQLSGITNIRFLTPDFVTNGKFSAEANRNNYARRNAKYGADKVVDIVAVADAGDESLLFVPTVARYGDKWYLVSTDSNTSSILGSSINQMAFALAPQDFEAYFTARNAEPTPEPLTAANFVEKAQPYLDKANTCITAAETAIHNIEGYLAQTDANIRKLNTARSQIENAEAVIEKIDYLQPIQEMEGYLSEANSKYEDMLKRVDKMTAETEISGNETENELSSSISRLGKHLTLLKSNLKKITKTEDIEAFAVRSQETRAREMYDKITTIIRENCPDLDLGEQFIPSEIILP